MQRSILIFMILIAVSLAAHAQTELRKDVLPAGGGFSGSGIYRMVCTVGQPCIGPMASPHYRHVAGFLALGGDSGFSGIEAEPDLPRQIALWQNYPNPCRGVTALRFDLPQEEHVQLEIYSMDGRRVARLLNRRIEPGRHAFHWNGRDSQGRSLASGTYLYRLRAGEFSATKQLLMLR